MTDEQIMEMIRKKEDNWDMIWEGKWKELI
jgi:hypothetical protein